jgi:hypothetical protein
LNFAFKFNLRRYSKDQLLAKDKTMYDNKSGHLNKKARH